MARLMKTEMTDVPEYRQPLNAPSQHTQDEAYNNGFKKGFKDGNLNGLRHALTQLNVVMDALKKTIDAIEMKF